jgi:serine phosphatase RsbU (regulator of sigma subunit)
MDGGTKHFGGARLRATIGRHRHAPLQQGIEALVQAVNDFRGGADPLDDVTVLALQRSSG